jgi:hypothetical protein
MKGTQSNAMSLSWLDLLARRRIEGTPDFNDVCDFDRSGNGLQPIEISVWEKWCSPGLTAGAYL